MTEIGISKSAADFSGLKWVRDLWGAEPRWTVRLNMESIQEVAKSTMPVPLRSTIKFLGRGAFNKLYIVKNYRKTVVVRVTLPVDPKWKTLSEVATLEWVHKMTFLPVPKVLVYDTDRRNPIGFEYIIMEKIRGKPLAKVWRDIDFDAKKKLVYDLAVFCAQTFQRKTNGIENLFPRREGNMEHLMIGRIVSAAFLWEDHIHQDVDRGPFRSSKEWLSARLTLAEINCQSPSLDRSTAEGDLEEIEKTMIIISKLRNRIKDFFPVKDQRAEATMIFHDDLSHHNILVDKKGVLMGVVDWECKHHDLRPMKGAYQRDKNGEVAELYWEHLEDYELTQLRRIFLENMRLLEPRRVEIFESSQDQGDFDLAVTSCGDPFLIRRICNWLEDMDSGVENLQGLEERIDNASL
ncbi:kinase-like domain-containing protein [Bisporella sp. PMI_857]|nr:kinase-like domain-containing protein [Bisporella sp. PMI_857]